MCCLLHIDVAAWDVMSQASYRLARELRPGAQPAATDLDTSLSNMDAEAKTAAHTVRKYMTEHSVLQKDLGPAAGVCNSQLSMLVNGKLSSVRSAVVGRKVLDHIRTAGPSELQSVGQATRKRKSALSAEANKTRVVCSTNVNTNADSNTNATAVAHSDGWRVGKQLSRVFDDGKRYVATVTAYDCRTGWYKLKYADGDAEDLSVDELESLLQPPQTKLLAEVCLSREGEKHKTPTIVAGQFVVGADGSFQFVFGGYIMLQREHPADNRRIHHDGFDIEVRFMGPRSFAVLDPSTLMEFSAKNHKDKARQLMSRAIQLGAIPFGDGMFYGYLSDVLGPVCGGVTGVGASADVSYYYRKAQVYLRDLESPSALLRAEKRSSVLKLAQVCFDVALRSLSDVDLRFPDPMWTMCRVPTRCGPCRCATAMRSGSPHDCMQRQCHSLSPDRLRMPNGS